MSQFAFLKSDFAEVHEHAAKAESLAKTDPRGACFYARLALETAVKWVYRNDGALGTPYETTLSAMINHSSFRRTAGEAIVAKAKVIQKRGNSAAHDSRSVRPDDAVTVVKELWHVSYWLVRTYGLGGAPTPGTQFSIDALPHLAQVKATSLKQLMAIAKQREAQDKRHKEAEKQLLAVEEERKRLEAELKAAREEVANIKARNEQVVDKHDYNEEETRTSLIDLLLHEAGWALDSDDDREFEVQGMPVSDQNPNGRGYADYVLWGADGKPLAVIEAKRTKRDPREGQHQAKLYADCFQNMFGQRPLIYYSNGYKHWLWDDGEHPPREVQGFYKRDELELVIQRRTSRKLLSALEIKSEIAGRYYQGRAIRRVGETFETESRRKALLVMATGTGKTRTAIALSDLLMRANWAKRILFLADRRALVRQAYNAFKAHLPSSTLATTNAAHDGSGNDIFNARVLVATYPSMMSRIDRMTDGVRDFGIGHFDLIIVDEAHRSIYKKFGAIFDYFDSHIVGLTATPKDEIDRDTYKTFDLQKGVPTDVYMLDEAVADGHLVPPIPYSVPIKFQREGIRYDDLSDEEKDEWDALEWSEEGEVPDQVDANAINDWLFNKDTVDKVLQHLMENGEKVEDGERLGKTIIFAKNDPHAQFIAERFNANYPFYKGHFAKVITYKSEKSQSLIDDFSTADKPPHIAISVDMLDTGIDVPEVVNLVFFKLVRSKTKFWQMIGRGTRLREDLYGPGKDKEHFAVFDFCQNFEFFNQNPDVREPRVAPSISERLFVRRLELISTLAEGIRVEPSGMHEDQAEFEQGVEEGSRSLRDETAALLHAEVDAMNLDNFIVRPKREFIEPFKKRDRWSFLSQDDLHVLSQQVAGLPTEREEDHLASKQFDQLIVTTQLALLRREGAFQKLRDRIKDTAKALEQLANLPQVQKRIELIGEVQTDVFWDGINVAMLEIVRRELRDLVMLIEPRKRKQVYTDFEDEIGEVVTTTLGGAEVGTNMAKFRAKTRRFLEDHQDHIAVRKLRRNEQLTPTDFAELERIMREQAGATDEDFEFVRNETDGLGVFIRKLVGLEQGAAKDAFRAFLNPATASADQIEFVNLIVDHLCHAGVLDPGRLYEPPFTDTASEGLDSVFDDDAANKVVSILREIRRHAEPVSIAGDVVAK